MDIIGIGGAFIDLTHHVSDARLVELGLRKAGISFVSPERQRFLIETNAAALTSTTHGGSVANSIYTAQKIGAKCAFASKIGNDLYGRSFAAELSSHGVMIASELCAGDTNTVLAFITPDGEKTFAVSPELASKLTFKDVSEESLRQSAWALIEGQLFSYGDDSKKAALDCLAFSKKINQKAALNLGSISVVEKNREIFHQLLAEKLITLVIGNADELTLLHGGSDIKEALRWVEMGAEYVVATKGSEGAIGRNRGIEFQVPPPTVSAVVDTSGAGDAFLGTLLASIAAGKPLVTSMERANQIAARVVQQHGARLETHEHL